LPPLSPLLIVHIALRFFLCPFNHPHFHAVAREGLAAILGKRKPDFYKA
jgi:hypothetical protein